MKDVSPEEREQIFQELWDLGSGFRFLFGGFSDISLDEDANQAAIDFIHKKITEIVKDEQVSVLSFFCLRYSKRNLIDLLRWGVFANSRTES